MSVASPDISNNSSNAKENSASFHYKIIKAPEGVSYVECLDGKKRKIKDNRILPCIPKRYLKDRRSKEAVYESAVEYDWDGKMMYVKLPTGEEIALSIRLCKDQKCACVKDPISWREVKVRCPRLERAEITENGIIIVADPYPFSKLLLTMYACSGYPRQYKDKRWLEGVEVIPGEFGWAKVYIETPSGTVIEEKELWGPIKMSAVRSPFGTVLTVCGDTSKTSYFSSYFDERVYEKGILIASFSQMMSPYLLTQWPPPGAIYIGAGDKVRIKTVVPYSDPAIFKYNKVLRIYEPIGTIYVESE